MGANWTCIVHKETDHVHFVSSTVLRCTAQRKDFQQWSRQMELERNRPYARIFNNGGYAKLNFYCGQRNRPWPLRQFHCSSQPICALLKETCVSSTVRPMPFPTYFCIIKRNLGQCSSINIIYSTPYNMHQRRNSVKRRAHIAWK